MSRRVEDTTDRAPVAGASLEDLDPRSVDRLLAELRTSRSHVLDGIDEGNQVAALQRLNILTRDGVPTFAGYVTLAAYPQQEFPRLVVDVCVHPGTTKSQEDSVRFIDRQA